MKYRSALLAAAAALITGTVIAAADLAPGINSTAQVVWTMAWENASTKPTYSATKVFSPASGATDVCSLSGSATKVVRVKRIIFAGITASILSENIAILRRASAYPNGSNGTGLSTASYDTSNAATTVNMAESWTGTPLLTTNAAATLIMDLPVWFGNTSTGWVGSPTVFEFGRLGSSLQLRGVAQNLAVNMNGQGANGSGTVACTFEWTEE